MASDTWSDNGPSARAHEALGFEIVDRCINFRKARGAPRGTARAASAAVNR